MKSKIRENEELKLIINNYEKAQALSMEANKNNNELNEIGELQNELQESHEIIKSQEEKINQLIENLKSQEEKINQLIENLKSQEEKFNDIVEKIKAQEELIKTQQEKFEFQAGKNKMQEEKHQYQTEKIKMQEERIEAQAKKIEFYLAQNEEKIMILLEQNSKLNKLCQENLISVEVLKKEKNEIERKYKSVTESNEQILKETGRFEQKIEEIEKGYDKLTENFLLVCAENDRIHEILEEFSPEIDSTAKLYIDKIENEKLLLENEANKWKLEYNDLKYTMKANEELVNKNQELNNTINNLFFSQSIDEDKYQKLLGELVEKIKFLSIENERLNNIILNRCKDMMNSW